MKKRFLILALTTLFALPSFAELTVKDTVDANYMKNQGYSTAPKSRAVFLTTRASRQ